MNWLKGGNWKLRDGEPIALVEGPRSVEIRDAAFEEFFSRPTEWAEKVGKPLGFRQYAVRDRDIKTILDRYGDFAKAYPRSGPAEWERIGSDGERDILLRLLKAWGPIKPLVGVVEPTPFMGGQGALRGVDLREFARDVRQVARATQWVKENPSVATARRLLRHGEGHLHRVAVRPRLANGELQFDVSPGSLGHLLWKELIERAADSVPERDCPYCGRRWELGPGNHPNVKYCPDHRGERFRVAVIEGRAPAKRLGGTSKLA